MNQNISCLLERTYFLCLESPIIYPQTYRTCSYDGLGMSITITSNKFIKELILVNIFGYIPTIRIH